MAKQRGFSVIELVIVVAIILILCAIAAVNLRKARITANQASAVSSLREINNAQAIYASTYPDAGYSSNLLRMGSNGSDCQSSTKSNACILDPSLASGIKSGYIFDLLGDGNLPDMSYAATATPQAAGISGDCTFTSTQSAQIASVRPPVAVLSVATGAGTAAACNGF